MFDRTLIGRALTPSTVTITAKEVAKFAAAIGDPDPVYRNLAAARAAGHAGIPLPPTGGIFLMLDRPERDEYIRLLNIDLRKMLHAEQSFAYHAPVYAGETLTLTDRITDIYDKKNGLLEFAVLECEARKATGELALTIRRVLVVRHG